MPVSALVVTLDSQPSTRARALADLAGIRQVAVGALCEDNRLPLVVESETADEGAKLLDALIDIPGVVSVDLVSVDFSDLDQGLA